MKRRVIDGDRKKLENRVIKNMLNGQICAEDLDRLKPWGNLYLVGSTHAEKAQTERLPAQSPETSEASTPP